MMRRSPIFLSKTGSKGLEIFKMLKGTWSVLKNGGILAINIHDIRKGSSFDRICDPMNDYFNSARSIICWWNGNDITMANTKADYSLAQTEPIWIWGKNNGNKNLRDYLEPRKVSDWLQPTRFI